MRPTSSSRRTAVTAALTQTALPAAPGRRIYIADHAWDGRTVGLTVAFDARARIGSLLISPREPLPADPAAGAPAAVLPMPVGRT